ARVLLPRRVGARAVRGSLHGGRDRDARRAARPAPGRARDRRRGRRLVIELSPVGLGTNNFGRRIDLARAREVVDAALELGVTHLDTADIYGDGDSERFLGEILEGRRREAIVATKFGHERGPGIGGSPDYVPRALEASLARLRTDYVDILYYH